jgi:hypothetical protein
MGCPALGVSVAFLKQPALPSEAPQTKKIINKTSQMNQKKFKNIFLIFFWRQTGQCVRLVQKSDPNPQCWTSHFWGIFTPEPSPLKLPYAHVWAAGRGQR